MTDAQDRIQKQIEEALFDFECRSDVEKRIYGSMRFDRESSTPEWQGGNSNAEQEARGCAAAVLDIVLAALSDLGEEYVRADLPPKVKPLEWIRGGVHQSDLISEDRFFRYHIYQNQQRNWTLDDGEAVAAFDYSEDAKAEAKKIHQHRILSALDL